MDQNMKRRIGERAVVRALLEHMKRKGWECWRTFDGDEHQWPVNIDAVMAAAFNLDEVSVRMVPAKLAEKFRAARAARAGHPKGSEQHAALVAVRDECEMAEHGLYLVFGNSPEEVLADWNYRDGDPDHFDAAVKQFDSEKIAERIDSHGTSAAHQCDQMAVLAGAWLPGKPLAVLFVGERGAVRHVGEAKRIEDVDAVLVAAGLSAGNISHAALDDYPGGWKREVFIAHA